MRRTALPEALRRQSIASRKDLVLYCERLRKLGVLGGEGAITEAEIVGCLTL